MSRLNFIQFLVIVFGIASTSLPAQEIVHPMERYGEAIRNYINGDYQTAINQLNSLCEPSVPTNYLTLKTYDWCGWLTDRAFYRRGWCYYRLGNCDQATRDFQRVSSLSYRFKANFMCRWCAFVSGDPNSLRDWLDDSSSRKHVLLWMTANFALGTWEWRHCHMSDATAYFDRVLTVNMDRISLDDRLFVLLLKGMASCWLGDWQAAINYLAAVPTSDFVCYYRASAYLGLGDTASAETQLMNISDSGHLAQEKQLFTAKLRLLQQDFQAAENAIDNYQDVYGLQHYYRGWLELLQCHFGLAEDSFTNFRSVTVQNIECWLRRMQCDAALRLVEMSQILSDSCTLTDDSINSVLDPINCRDIWTDPQYIRIIESISSGDVWECLQAAVATGNIRKQNNAKDLIAQDDQFLYALGQTIGGNPDYDVAATILAGLSGDTYPQDEIDYAHARVLKTLWAIQIFPQKDPRRQRAEDLLQPLIDRGSIEACYFVGDLYDKDGNFDEACRYYQRVTNTPRLSWIGRPEERTLELGCPSPINVKPLPNDNTNKHPRGRDMFLYDFICDREAALVALKQRFYEEFVYAIRRYHESFYWPEKDLVNFLDIPSPEIYLQIYGQEGTRPSVIVNCDTLPVSESQEDYQYISERTVQPGWNKIRIECDGFFDWVQDICIYDQEVISVHLVRRIEFSFPGKLASTVKLSCFDVEDNTTYLLSPCWLSRDSQKFTKEDDIPPMAMEIISGVPYIVAENGVVYKAVLDLSNKVVSSTEFIRDTSRPIDMAVFVEGEQPEFVIIDEVEGILKYNYRGECTDTIALTEDSLVVPADGVSDKSDNLYVVDSGNHRILKFDRNLNHIGFCGMDGLPGRYEIGEKGQPDTTDGFLFYPTSVTVDEDGLIYVADLSGRIQLFNIDGSHLATFRLGDKDAFVAELFVKGHGKGSKLYLLEKKPKDGRLDTQLRTASAK